MLLTLFGLLRRHRLPVSTGEWLDLLSALKAGVVFSNLDGFYYLARLCLVKDERYFDRFDQAFSAFMAGLDAAPLDTTDALLVGAHHGGTCQVVKPSSWMRRRCGDCCGI